MAWQTRSLMELGFACYRLGHLQSVPSYMEYAKLQFLHSHDSGLREMLLGFLANEDFGVYYVTELYRLEESNLSFLCMALHIPVVDREEFSSWEKNSVYSMSYRDLMINKLLWHEEKIEIFPFYVGEDHYL